MTSSARMTSYQRREQLIAVGRSLFAAKGFEAVSVEEIAAVAKVSKPIVYEHFGGKEGLYAVVVDREMRALTDALASALADPEAHPRQIVERTALALLTYIEENAEGFHVLVRDSPSTDPAGSFNSLLGDVSLRVEEILTEAFRQEHFPPRGVPYYAQMLVGLTVFTGQYWADRRKVSKEQLAAHIVNLAWYGLSRLQPKPELLFEGERAKRAEQKRLAKEAKERKAREEHEEHERAEEQKRLQRASRQDHGQVDHASDSGTSSSRLASEPESVSASASESASGTADGTRAASGTASTSALTTEGDPDTDVDHGCEDGPASGAEDGSNAAKGAIDVDANRTDSTVPANPADLKSSANVPDSAGSTGSIDADDTTVPTNSTD